MGIDIDKWRHDLKNQLGIIVGFSELLLTELDAVDPHRGDVEEINTAVQRALDLLSQITDAGSDEL